MDYQTFRGSDVKEALFAVRQALGADALIGSTRHVDNGKRGAFGRSFVEVTAAPGNGPPTRTVSRRGKERRGDDRRAAERRSVARSKRTEVVAMQRELTALRNVVDQLTAARPPRERVRAHLHAAGFEAEQARSLALGGTKAAKAGPIALNYWLRKRLGERLLFQPQLIARNFRQLMVCVGPTGVGKTTTLAKLAARAKLELGRSVSVITLDTFRVGAVEQWKRYAELIGVGFDIVEEPSAFQRIVESQPSDLILVDTPGQSTQDDVPTLRLAQCLSTVASMRTEVQLVLPAWIRAKDAERIAKSYQDPHLTGLIVTKMDEAEQMGGALHAALSEQLPVTYLCDGPRVPEDVHDAEQDTVLEALFPEHV